MNIKTASHNNTVLLAGIKQNNSLNYEAND